MKTFRAVQNLPVDLQTAWDFFSSPANLNKITPEYMRFRILTDLPDKMYPGLIIKYTVRPLLGIRLTWVTEISQVKEPHYFVDNQIKGPYRIWHHEHHFKEISGGVEMTDIVSYAAPFGILGRLAEKIMVDKKVEEIFAYREKRLLEIYGPFREAL